MPALTLHTPATRWCACLQDEIAANLRNIRDDSWRSTSEANAANAVGVLTSERRDTWARARAGLEAASEMNKRALFCIDSALFVVCLDDFGPDSLSAQSSNCLTGTSQVESGVQGKHTWSSCRWQASSLWHARSAVWC